MAAQDDHKATAIMKNSKHLALDVRTQTDNGNDIVGVTAVIGVVILRQTPDVHLAKRSPWKDCCRTWLRMMFAHPARPQ